MPFEYITHDGQPYKLSYPGLKQHYQRFCAMTDQEFLDNLPKAAHLACIISWLKELPADLTIGDTGIVHELIHLIDNTKTAKPKHYEVKEIRKMFKEYLKLV